MVGINGVHEAYSLHTAMGSRPVNNKKVTEEAVLGRETGAQDQVIISPEASFRARLEVASKQVAAAPQPRQEVSAERMSQLKAQYAGDNCPVSGADIAQSMLGRACGILPAAAAQMTL